MSRAWSRGSTRAWRITRAFVLARDRWTCQLCGNSIPRDLPPEHDQAAQVHHTRGKAHGDDPRYLVAAHRKCNQRVGDPTKNTEPRPQPMTRW